MRARLSSPHPAAVGAEDGARSIVPSSLWLAPTSGNRPSWRGRGIGGLTAPAVASFPGQTGEATSSALSTQTPLVLSLSSPAQESCPHSASSLCPTTSQTTHSHTHTLKHTDVDMCIHTTEATDVIPTVEMTRTHTGKHIHRSMATATHMEESLCTLGREMRARMCLDVDTWVEGGTHLYGHEHTGEDRQPSVHTQRLLSARADTGQAGSWGRGWRSPQSPYQPHILWPSLAGGETMFWGLSGAMATQSLSEPSWRVVGLLGCWWGFPGSTEAPAELGAEGKCRGDLRTTGCSGILALPLLPHSPSLPTVPYSCSL